MAVRQFLLAGAGLALLLGQPAANQAPPAPDPAPIAFEDPNEEFVGPFASWRHAKNDYGAVGDGTADDTAALQRALDELGRERRSPVLFVPAGRYRLTAALRLSDRQSVSVLGEDPARVALVWGGAAGGTMLEVNGIAYSRISRLTFDGRGSAAIGVSQAWDNKTGPFDTGNEYADVTFTDLEHGIRGGFSGYGFAETTIIRAHFVRNTKAGVALGNFNALDAWIRDSTFEDCGIGVTNDPGAGNFRVYSSLFRRSVMADLAMQNTGVFSVRGNHSVDSRAFFVSDGPFPHPAVVDIQHNTIVDPQDAVAIRLGNQGPGFITDNIIRSRAGHGGPAISWRSRAEADVFSIGNTFTVARPITANGRFVSLDERIVPRASLDLVEPRMPGALPNRGRDVIEVPAGADAPMIQRALNDAAMRKGRRPVVHLPFGSYSLAAPLRVPPSDVQLVGDGVETRLMWASPRPGAVLTLDGPTRATLRELSVDGASRATGLLMAGVDQQDARLYMEGIQLRRGHDANLLVDRVQQVAVEIVDIGHAYMETGTSILLRAGKTTIFSGASSGNALSYDVSGGATLLARDIWYEGNAPRGFARIHGKAAATFQSVRVSTPAGKGPPAFVIADLDGRVSILGSHVDDRLALEGDGRQARVLVLALFREHQESPFLVSPVAADARFLLVNGRQRARTRGFLSPGSVALPNIGVSDAAFLREMLEDARRKESGSRLDPRPDGTSDVRLFRVAVENGVVNVHVVPEPSTQAAQDGQRPAAPIQ